MNTDSDQTPNRPSKLNLEVKDASSDNAELSSTPTMASSASHQHQSLLQQQLSPSMTGPRPAPSYSVMNVNIEKKEDGPGSRCGHTLTSVAPVGEEGTPGYIGPRLILFGGATALEGNSATSPVSSAGSAGIRKSFFHCWFHFF